MILRMRGEKVYKILGKAIEFTGISLNLSEKQQG